MRSLLRSSGTKQDAMQSIIMKILQGNMNKIRIADALLPQLLLEEEADILLLSEPYRRKDCRTWFSSTRKNIAIWIPNPRQARVEQHGAEEYYVWARIDGITYVSCYFSPNDSILEFEVKLGMLEDHFRDTTQELVIAGDFNARAPEWGMLQTNKRG
ncbi:hypothetical protein J437_LFUL002851 [Ladona fulva]|uniref:Endonuclease/exonuclease/phosphatase domain-containing protein n=1 Tax=Ladona fulva TaxID=123851 RepID=A0A8K0NW79_LADFU|nr:hypothetical protein J437_LFUL002851 [Ladona fulva]